MAAASATGALTNGKRPSRRTATDPPLSLVAVDRALTELLGGPPRRDRLERDDRAYRWCARKLRAEGNPFRSTLQQAATGMGYATSGDYGQDHDRFGNNVRRAMNSLQDAGLLRWGGIKRPNGQWWCIEVELLDNAGQRLISVVM